MGKVNVYSSGMCHCSVCADSDMSIEEISVAVNRDNPTGLSHDWVKSEANFASGEENPCVCLCNKGKLHYLFVC